MKRILYFFILCLLVISNRSIAQDTLIFPKGEKSPNVHHTGNVWLKELNEADSIFNYSTSVATFDRGARLDWHTHPGGQILLILSGAGYYQESGKPIQTVRKGDVVKCLPGIEHWHGATPESGVSYLATSPAQKGKTIWGRKLTAQEYSAGK